MTLSLIYQHDWHLGQFIYTEPEHGNELGEVVFIDFAFADVPLEDYSGICRMEGEYYQLRSLLHMYAGLERELFYKVWLPQMEEEI